MKKLLFSLVLVLIATVSYSAPKVATVVNASGASTSCNIVLPAVSGRYIAITGVTAKSDSSTAYLDVFVGAEAGVTTGYTQIARWDVGAATKQFVYQGAMPMIAVSQNYAVKLFVSSSTTINGIAVTYDYQY